MQTPYESHNVSGHRVDLFRGEDGGIVVEVPAILGCITQGKDREEALANAAEAIAVSALGILGWSGDAAPEAWAITKRADVADMDRTDMDSRYPLGAVAPTQEPDVPDVISDVTERVVSDLRHAIRTTNNKRMRGVADNGGSMTPLRTKMLAAAQGMELGKWHNALIYDKAMSRLPVLEHKAIVSLALGGKIRILEVWGAHPDTPHSSTHYRLAALNAALGAAD